MSLLDADIPSVDLRSALDGIIRRWWLVVLSVVIAVGIVFAQDSGLRTDPAGKVVVDRTYEAVIETDELAIVKVDPSAIVPVPSFDNQLAILRSDETVARLRENTGADGSLSLSRSEPKFTITESIDDLNNRVSFLATGTPSYTFQCVGDDEASCNSLLDAYVAKTAEMRKESVLGGLEGGRVLMDSLIAAGQDRLTGTALDERQRVAQESEIASLITKRDALATVAQKVTGELILVTKSSFIQGRTTASVTGSTYGFGLGVGLVVGLLLALQLAALDKKIRYSWQIGRVSDSLTIIGSPFARKDEAQVAAIAAALETSRHAGVKSALISAPSALSGFADSVLARTPQISGTVIGSLENPTVDQLAGGQERAVVILVKAGETTRQELAESLGLLTAGGNRLLGVALIS